MAITNNHKSQVNENYVYVSSYPISQAFERFWFSEKAAMIAVMASILVFMANGFALLIALVFTPILIINLTSLRRMPVKMPKSSGEKKDLGSLKAGTDNQYNSANAITCLGVDRETNKQVWEDSDNERRHFAFIATTGSGKTFSLRFSMMMALVQTTGIIAIDGKGDIALPLESLSLIRRFMREDDIRILNFKQGATNVYFEDGTPRTNTFNPFATGSSSYIAEILKALLSSDGEGAKGGDMWQKRAEGMCENIAKMATYKRDHSDFKIRPRTIAEMLELRELCRIYCDESIPEDYKASLRVYFATLPDFEIESVKLYAEGEEFKGKTLEQAGYVSMQLQPALQVLSDLYGFIFDTDTPEIDLKDIAINNRILLGLLPAMEQSIGTLNNTGKIILAALKGMIAGELGTAYQGNIKEILSQRACSDPAPFKVFLDECGYYAIINGIEILPAQGRGLGFAFYFIAQTYTDLEKAGKDIGDIIWGNTNNKTIGKTESESTYNKVSDRLGEMTVLVRENLEVRTGDFMTERINADRIAYVKRKRLEMQDLTKLAEGQFYHITNNKLISMRGGNPFIKESVIESRYNQFVGLANIPEETKLSLKRNFATAIARFKKNLSGTKSNPIRLDAVPKLRSIVSIYNELAATGQSARTLTEYQIKLYQLANNENSIIVQNTDERVKNVMSKIGIKQNANAKDEEVIGGSTPANLDDIETPTDGWGVDTSKQEKYRDFGYSKSNIIADLERELIGSQNEPDADADADAFDESISLADEITGEIEYHTLQLNLGQITQEEYDDAVKQLHEELSKITSKKDDDSEGGDDDFSSDKTIYNIEDAPIDALNVPPPAPSINEYYPSPEARKLGEKVNKETINDILEQIEKTYQIDI